MCELLLLLPSVPGPGNNMRTKAPFSTPGATPCTGKQPLQATHAEDQPADHWSTETEEGCLGGRGLSRQDTKMGLPTLLLGLEGATTSIWPPRQLRTSPTALPATCLICYHQGNDFGQGDLSFSLEISQMVLEVPWQAQSGSNQEKRNHSKHLKRV